MSELISGYQARNALRWRLLTTASSLALLASICSIRDAKAEDTDRPTVWIELGGDLDRVDSGQQAFTPLFVTKNAGSAAFDPVSPTDAQKPTALSFGGDGKISFQPEDSNWVFAASIRYGRSNGNREVHQTEKNAPSYQHITFKGNPNPPQTFVFPTDNFLAVTEKQSASHAIADFQVGRDFGIGLFGRDGTSVFNAGVRFTQFSSRMQANIQAIPDFTIVEDHLPTPHHPFNNGTLATRHYHVYQATAQSARSFHGIGPSLSWNASAPFAGRPEGGELSVDWGANAAVLFGRQKAKVQHHTSARYVPTNYAFEKYPPTPPGMGYNHAPVNLQRARTVIVPNFGGFAGVTFSFTSVKVSAGYRGDFFFGAMDTGFDAAKKSTIGFYGPFASMSIGIGG